MDNKIDRFESKLDKLMEKLCEVEIQLARNTDSLEVHEKRSDLNEREIELVQAEVAAMICSFKADIGGIKDHVKLVNIIVMKVIPVAAAVLMFLLKFKIMPS